MPLVALPVRAGAWDVAAALDRLCRLAKHPQEIWIDHAFDAAPGLRDFCGQHGITIVFVPSTPYTKAVAERIIRDLDRFIRGKTLTDLGHDLETSCQRLRFQANRKPPAQ